MSETVEKQLADRLRVIAEQAREWENRDVREAMDRGEEGIRRPLYFHELQVLASMLEGSHREVRLTAKSKRGRPAALTNVDRDMAIAKMIQEVHEASGSVEDGIEQAMATFHVSEGTARAARLKYGSAAGSDNSQALAFFHKLAAKGLCTIERVPAEPKK